MIDRGSGEAFVPSFAPHSSLAVCDRNGPFSLEVTLPSLNHRIVDVGEFLWTEVGEQVILGVLGVFVGLLL